MLLFTHVSLFTYVDNAVVLLLVDCDIGMSYALVCVVLALVLLLPLTYNNNKVREESVRERQLFPTGRDKTVGRDTTNGSKRTATEAATQKCNKLSLQYHNQRTWSICSAS